MEKLIFTIENLNEVMGISQLNHFLAFCREYPDRATKEEAEQLIREASKLIDPETDAYPEFEGDPFITDKTKKVLEELNIKINWPKEKAPEESMEELIDEILEKEEKPKVFPPLEELPEPPEPEPTYDPEKQTQFGSLLGTMAARIDEILIANMGYDVYLEDIAKKAKVSRRRVSDHIYLLRKNKKANIHTKRRTLVCIREKRK